LVFNKIDRLTHEEEDAFRNRARALFDQPMVFTSAVETDGLSELKAMLLDEMRKQRPEVHVEIPYADGEALATIYREGEVLRRDEQTERIGIVARLPLATLGRLRNRSGIVVSEA